MDRAGQRRAKKTNCHPSKQRNKKLENMKIKQRGLKKQSGQPSIRMNHTEGKRTKQTI